MEKSPIAKSYFLKLVDRSDWDIETVKIFDSMVNWINKTTFDLDIYPNQYEIVTAEQMLDAYSLTGLPLSYNHWKFGKGFSMNEGAYKRGQMGLSYEMVINSNPCISYNMEENSTVLLLLVMIHAGIGHNAFFKNNYLFKQWTHADAIIDYMGFAKRYIRNCEDKYGHEEVEKILDACHALMNYGVSKYKKPFDLDPNEEEHRVEETEMTEYAWSNHHLWPKALIKKPKEVEDPEGHFSPEENILYFLEKNSPILKNWQKEIVRIVRKISQYFYPQAQCLTGDTYVYTRSGMVKFKDLITDEGYYNQLESLLSIDNKFEKTSHFYKKKVNNTIRIKTELGKVIEGTPEHPILTINKDLTFSMKKLSEFKKGDFIVNKVKYLNSFSDDNFKIDFKFNEKRELVTCEICGNGYGNLSTHITTHGIDVSEYKSNYSENIISEKILYDRSGDVRVPSEVNENIARLLGYFISEGSWSMGSFSISNQDLDIIDDIKNIFINEFNITPVIVGDKTKTITTHNAKFFDILEYLGLKRNLSYFKEIPKCILQSKKEVVISFLRSLFEGDGTNASIGQISYSTRSYELSKQVQILLNNLGIVSKIIESDINYEYKIEVPHKKNYKVVILGYFYDEFLNVVGFMSDRKNEKNTYSENISLNTFGVPYLNEILKELSNRIDPNTSKNKTVRRERLPKSRSKNSFKWEHIDDQIEKFEHIKLIDEDLYNRIILTIDKSNYYDEIVDIESINEDKYVYDVTIPSNHLFLSDTYISHNTKTINEGVATYIHHTLINELSDRGFLTDKFMLEFYHHHSNVVYQAPHRQFNPYTLGFNIIKDVERIVKEPTEEDKEWFPNLIGRDWTEVFKEIIEGYKDDSFIHQFLSPKVIRDMRMFDLFDEEGSTRYVVENIHDERGYKEIREKLAKSKNRATYVPEINVVHVDWFGDRSMTLQYTSYNNRKLKEESIEDVMDYVQALWGFEVKLIDENGDDIYKV